MHCRKGQAKGYTHSRIALVVPKDDATAIGGLLGKKVIVYSASNGVDY